jgi:hypothetical protein
MSIGTVSGTIISISASAPVSYDVQSYELLSFTPIGNIEDAGEHGRGYSEFTFQTIGADGVRKYKNKYNEGNKILEIAYDSKDPGINLLKQALISKNDYSFSVKYPSGDVDYFRAKITRLSKSIGNINSLRKISATLSITTQNNVGIVEYLQTLLALENNFSLLQEDGSKILI